MEGNKEELLEQMEALNALTRENPCGMSEKMLYAVLTAIKAILSDRWMKGGSRERVAVYLERDKRTVNRWMRQYKDFPKARHEGNKSVTFNWLDVVRWKLRHKELYER